MERTRVLILLACCLAARTFAAAASVTVTGLQKLTASDARASANFGSSVAVDGDMAVLGASDVNGNSNGNGEAYVFTRSNGVWRQTAKLLPADESIGRFGAAVAINNGTIAVGDYVNSVVYVFTQSGTGWVQQSRVVAPLDAEGAGFGWSVALSGGVLAIGAPFQFPDGALYVFTQSGGWTQQAELTLSDAAAQGSWHFGFSVSASGATIAVGSPANGAPCGRAFVFTFSNGTWQQSELQRFTPGSGASCGSKQFGTSVTIGGGTVVVGAPDEGDTSNNLALSGAAYVFAQSGGVWKEQATLTASDAATDSFFGYSVAIDGSIIVIGAYGNTGYIGSAYVFTQSGAAWTQLLELGPPDGTAGEFFGASVAVSGGVAFAGAPGKNIGNLQSAGEAYVFEAANAVVLSNPSGRSFQLTGTGCKTPGQFTTPYAGFWSTCSLEWTSPDTATPKTRYTFENWWDGSTDNPRTFVLDENQQTVISADFRTEYQLTTISAPAGAGQITGGGFYPLGASAIVDAVAEPGAVFTGFGGALTGSTTPQPLLITGPTTVTAFFAQTPAAASGAIISAKSGPANNRTWTVTVTNNGPGVSYDARLDGVMVVQTFGASCAPAPLRLSPASFPVPLGTLALGGMAQASLTFDFSGCPANARFSVTIGEVSNGGSSVGVVQLVNQFQ